MKISEQEFLQETLKLFPDLKEDLLELDNLLHLQMDRFRYRVEEELQKRNKEKILKSFMLIERCYRYGGETLKDAVDTSFVEGIFAGHDKETIKWAWELMPQILRDLYVSFWGKNAI